MLCKDSAPVYRHAQNCEVRINSQQLTAEARLVSTFLSKHDGIGFRSARFLENLHRPTAIANHFHVILFVDQPANRVGHHHGMIRQEHPDLIHEPIP